MNKKKEKSEPNEKHLDYIQSIISRMAQNSFQAKTWGITVITGLLAFCLSSESVDLRNVAIKIACVITILFGFVDTYYLYLERGYRELYNIVAGIKHVEVKVKEYDLAIPKEYRCMKNIYKSFAAWSTGVFYLTIIFLLIVLKDVLE